MDGDSGQLRWSSGYHNRHEHHDRYDNGNDGHYHRHEHHGKDAYYGHHDRYEHYGNDGYHGYHQW